jgi:5-formyltetrahydrofolate cyclo-ligase
MAQDPPPVRKLDAARPFAPEVEAELARRVKVELRKSMQRTRAATPAAARRDASRAIATRLVEEGLLAGARGVALFRPIERKGEVDTTAIDEAARTAGARVAYPFLEEPPWDGTPYSPENPPPAPTMSFRWVPGGAPLEDAFEDLGHGFPEPRASLPSVGPGEIDLVIVPGLAFDPRGHRLGYGAGYYDRFLAGLPNARTVGIGFDFQLLAEIPVGTHDLPVAWVVTERRALRCTR